MREFFSKYGTITDLVRMKDKETGWRIQTNFSYLMGFFVENFKIDQFFLK